MLATRTRRISDYFNSSDKKFMKHFVLEKLINLLITVYNEIRKILCRVIMRAIASEEITLENIKCKCTLI